MFLILVNGTSRSSFISSRGLRQEDPLSPFLFSVVADGISPIHKKAERVGLIQGFRVSDGGQMVSHL